MRQTTVFKHVLLLAAALGLAALPAEREALAEEPTAAELSDQAYARYEAGDYPEAVALYMKAYALNVDSRILFNVAQIYDRKVQDRDLALEYYRRYLKSTTTEVELVRKATERVTELQRQTDTLAQPTATTPAGPKAAAPTATPAGPTTAAPTATEQPRSGPAVWVGYGVAGLFAAGAVVTGALALSTSGDVSKGAYTGTSVPADLDASASRAKALGATTDVLIGSAVVSAAVTLVVHLTASRGSSEKAAAAKLVPSGPGLIWRF